MSRPRFKALVSAGPLGAALAFFLGCGGTSTKTPEGPAAAGSVADGGKNASPGGAASGGAAGTGVTPAGGTSGGGNAGAATSGSGNAGLATSGGGGSSAGNGGSNNGGSGGAHALTDPITAVVKSDGCGQVFAGPPGMPITLQTMGVKDANCADKTADGKQVCGAWSTPRQYFVYLPQNYDPTKPYSLVFQAPGCGGKGTDIFPLNGLADSAIRVGLSPGPNSTGHGTNPEQGCFDDKEGDDSIDFVFYEALYDVLNAQLCFDRHRVFASGNSSGAWLTNELGCKYTGDAIRPLRGVMAMNGGLPTEPQFAPTCTSASMAGIWVQEVDDSASPFAGSRVAIARAMAVNHCPPGQTYDTADLVGYAIGGGKPDDTCKSIRGCDPLYPLVVCLLPGQGQGTRDDVVEPGFATFVRSFQYPPLLPP